MNANWAKASLAAVWTCLLFVAVLIPSTALAQPPTEQNCSDRVDEDGDTVTDCGDHDCHDDPACQADGNPENTSERCSDWVDNDSDGFTDCEDMDCDGTEACMGSWDKAELAPPDGGGGGGGGGGGAGGGTAGENERPEDMIGTGGDNDGERNNYFCSDGIDNDGDGLTDCEDVGCRLDTQVTVCQPDGNFRFSVVARVAQSYTVQAEENESNWNTEFESLQMRVLGQIPFIQNSFFLISMRAEKTPRVTFANFQVPIAKGHYVQVNSGGGGLSLELVRSTHKRLLVDPAFYVYNAFEQGNGAAIEFGGPLSKNGKFLYRTFAAGGSGRFSGNIGGTFFPDDNRNYTWSVGAQLHVNIVGYYNRFDTPLLYVKAPTTLTLDIGAKYDQRAQERFPAVNAQLIFRWRWFHLSGEFYGKRELNFQNWQYAFNTQLGVLVWPKRILLAADFGQYRATDFERPPNEFGFDLRRQQEELQYRVAAHVYLWRDVFYASLVWRDRRLGTSPADRDTSDVETRQDIRLVATYRF